MKLDLTKSSYSVGPIDRDQFLCFIKKEGDWDRGWDEIQLYEELDKLDGVNDTNYDGHFGPYIFLNIEVECDTPETHEQVIQIILRHLKDANDGL